jgi:hypothetical protein
MAGVEIKGLKEFDDMLAKLPERVRRVAINHALRESGKVVKSQMEKEVPVGDPKHKPDKKPLKETIGYVLREYASGDMMIVIGPMYPAGAHAHLTDKGFRHKGRRKSGGSTITFVKGKKWMNATRAKSEAAANTQFHKAMEKGFEKAVKAI